MKFGMAYHKFTQTTQTSQVRTWQAVLPSTEHLPSHIPETTLGPGLLRHKAEAHGLHAFNPKGLYFTVILYRHVVLGETVLFQFPLPHNYNSELKGFEVPNMVSTTSIYLVNWVNMLSDN